MLASQLNALLNDGVLKKNSIVVLKKYVLNSINGKRIVIITGLDVTHSDFARVVGSWHDSLILNF